MYCWLFYLYYLHSSLQTVSPLFWEEVEDWTVHVQTQCGHRWVHCTQYFFPNVAYECYNDPCFPSSCGNCQVKRQQTAGEQKHIPPLHRNMKELCLIKQVYVHQTTHTHTHTDQHVTHILWCIHVHTSVGVLQHTHTHTHTHTCWFLWFMGTLHRRNGFYTEQSVCAIALNLPYT